MDNSCEAVDKVIHKKLWITCVAHCGKKIKKKFSTKFVEKKCLTQASPAATAARGLGRLIYSSIYVVVVVYVYSIYIIYMYVYVCASCCCYVGVMMHTLCMLQ